MTCQGCGARLNYGQSKDKVTIYPKKRANKVDLPHGGWEKWEGSQQDTRQQTRTPPDTRTHSQPPPQPPARSMPHTGPAPTSEDPVLRKYLERGAQSSEEAENVQAELLGRLETIGGPDLKRQCWEAAFTKGPKTPDADLITNLYRSIKSNEAPR
jgi:hypothetical protein